MSTLVREFERQKVFVGGYGGRERGGSDSFLFSLLVFSLSLDVGLCGVVWGGVKGERWEEGRSQDVEITRGRERGDIYMCVWKREREM